MDPAESIKEAQKLGHRKDSEKIVKEAFKFDGELFLYVMQSNEEAGN